MVDDMDTKPTDPEPTELDATEAPLEETSAEEAPVEPTPEEQLERLTDKLRRVEAEFVNETKRIRRKAEDDRKYAVESVVVDLLPVVDALAAARDALPEDDATQAMREGLGLVEQQLQAVFKRYGIAAIEAQDKPFDPARHQAMLMVERADLPPQTVCEVMRLGYELHGRVIRPAEVLVSKAPVEPAPEPSAESSPGELGEGEAAGDDA